MFADRSLEKNIDFRQQRLLNNISRILLVSKVFIAVILWVGFFNLFGMLFMNFRPAFAVVYLILYGSFGLFNIVYSVIGQKVIKEANWTNRKIVKWESIVMVYLVVSIAWGTGVSLVDQIEYKHIMMFSLCMLLCSSLFYISMKKMILLSLISTVFIFTGLLFAYPAPINFYAQLYLFFLILFVSFLLSRIVYSVFLNAYLTTLHWHQELENNLILTEQLQILNNQLAKKAHYDELTNVFNRHGFQAYIDNLFSDQREYGIHLTIILIDIDYFKNFNDHYGHRNGDQVLKTVVETVDLIVNKYGCTTVRWGGEEFIVAGTDISTNQVEDICREIEYNISKLHILHKESNISRFLTVSMGASTKLCTNPDEIEEVINNADAALYNAKGQGRNSYQILV